jgi:hypothetical protein
MTAGIFPILRNARAGPLPSRSRFSALISNTSAIFNSFKYRAGRPVPGSLQGCEPQTSPSEIVFTGCAGLIDKPAGRGKKKGIEVPFEIT